MFHPLRALFKNQTICDTDTCFWSQTLFWYWYSLFYYASILTVSSSLGPQTEVFQITYYLFLSKGDIGNWTSDLLYGKLILCHLTTVPLCLKNDKKGAFPEEQTLRLHEPFFVTVKIIIHLLKLCLFFLLCVLSQHY